MADAADALATRCGITRAAQDAFAIESHARASDAAARRGAEITPLGGISADSFTRNLTAPLCARAATVSGTITAANAAVAADGAAFCVLVSEKIAARITRATVQIISGVTCGADPAFPGIAPVAAIRASLRAAGLTAPEIGVVEMMEAYAAQAIACIAQTGLVPERTNLGGGALARGHPIGASGAINAVRLLHELRRSGGTGLAAIAAAGGLGTAMVLRAGG